MPKYHIEEIEVDEDIDNYWASLDLNDRNWSIQEEINSRKLLSGMKLLTDEQYTRLKETPQTSGRPIVGAHSYDILCNPLYCQQFVYLSSSIAHRDMFIIDNDLDESNDMVQSDAVRVALNLAYLTEADISNAVFSQKDFYSRVSKKDVENTDGAFLRDSNQPIDKN